MARPRKPRGRGTPLHAAEPRPYVGQDDVYGQMLHDALSSSFSPSREERPLKKRRVGGRIVTQANVNEQDDLYGRASNAGTFTASAAPGEVGVAVRQQTTHDTDDSTDSDVDWEEVDLQEEADEADHPSARQGDLNLVLDDGKGAASQRQPSRRKATSPAEKQIRLDIHKMHILCLVAHIYLRNHWCNDDEIHIPKRPFDQKTVSYLNPDEKKSQFQRSRSFNDGLSQALDAFRISFNITARGLSRPYWAENADAITDIKPPTDIDLPMQKPDFREAGRTRQGSRDVGAQLFCSLLRAVGVDARLTCSLQVLPINASAAAKPPPFKKPMGVAYYQSDQKTDSAEENVISSREQTPTLESPRKLIGSSGGRNRFASPLSASATPSGAASTQSSRGASTNRAWQQKRIVESPYPVYWVEAFDEANQKWIPVDPFATRTIGKSRKFEPPASDHRNSMTYVISFEDDGFARDVTKRYAKSYNAKTRRSRVEVTSEGERWIKRVLKMYGRSHRMDRDQVEDTELAQKEAQEGLPQNVQDFKDHPYYALERHLRRHEIIHPRREVGKVSAGRGTNNKAAERIYRRRDVQIVKSADKWYRVGREIKPGEQPLKRVIPRRGPNAARDQSPIHEDNGCTALYAYHQTIDYKPPPVVNGRIPKNVYGNLDIYVPSMVPYGATHLRHPETQRAAKLLGVDVAEAVTGFAFKGRHGTAITNGAVVATEYADAVQQVLNGFEDAQAEEEEARRSLECLRMWKHFLIGLRIRERIAGYEIEGEEKISLETNEDETDQSPFEEEGGYLPDPNAESIAEPTARGWTAKSWQEPENGGGGFIPEVDSTSLTEPTNIAAVASDGQRLNELGGGGFLPQGDGQGGEFDKNGDEQGGDNMENSHGGAFVTSDEHRTQKQPHSAPVIASGHHRSSMRQTCSFDEESKPILVPKNKIQGNTEDVFGRQATTSAIPSDFGIVPEELEQATILQQSFDLNRSSTPNHRGKQRGSPRSPTSTPQSPMGIRTEVETASNTSTSGITPPSKSASICSRPADVPEQQSADGSDSLLSEDPSDEDADPEWIA